MNRLAVALAMGIVVVAVPSAAFADAAKPSDFRSEIVSVLPATDAITATIEGGDSFVRIEVAPGHDVVVEGYADEPYLWIDADGVVHENQHSPATYYNRSRAGVPTMPPQADATATPDWKVVGHGGTYAWHDHRAHWMGGNPPSDMHPGDSRPPQVVPLTVDGVPTEITVLITLVASPSPWPAIAGGVIGAVLVLAAAAPRRRLPAWVAIVIVGGAATVVGLVQYMSLPPETGPRWSWWVPPVIATVCGAALPFVPRSAPWLRAAFVLVAGAQLLLWGWTRRSGLVKPVLPTSAPFWLDRLVSAGCVDGRNRAGRAGGGRARPRYQGALSTTATGSVIGSALANSSVTSNVWPAASGWTRPTSITCLPPGVNVTAVPGSSATPERISCIPVAPVAVVIDSCISA